MINAPLYRRRRIGSLDSFSMSMGLTVRDLDRLVKNADRLYRTAQSIRKADGSLRYTYDAYTSLKTVHRRIKNHIFDHVVYPPYLTGSLKGRDYKVNASLHTQAKIVISDDISSFFPSTTVQHVFDVWKNFFNFDGAVAHRLTMLTTRYGELPQGAITSSFLANLVFWKHEPVLQALLAAKGMTYSRYVDDIAVSSRSPIRSHDKAEVIRHVYGMLSQYGYEPNRSKHDISTASKRMTVTKLSVNAKPGLAVKTRANIRAAVHGVEQLASAGKLIQTDSGVYATAMGRVQMLRRFHPGEAEPLRQRLLAVRKNIS